MLDKLPEKTLIGRCIKKDKECWSEFIRRYSPFLSSLINKKLYFLNFPHSNEDVEDISVNTFNSFVENDYALLKKYNPAYAFRTWLAVIALTQCNRFVRKKKVNTSPIDNKLPGHFDTPSNNIKERADGPEITVEKSELSENIKKAIQRLEPREQLIVTMLFFDRLKYMDIARVLKIPSNSISKVIFRVKEKLKEELKKEGIKDILS